MHLPTGLYQHYKGPLYEVMDLARHSETEIEHVVYRTLYGDFKTWIRPLDMFQEEVEYKGKTLPRFRYLGDESESDTLLTLYHTPFSRSVRVKLLLDMMKVPYQLETVDLSNKSDDFLELSPYDCVPLITQGDVVLYESGAIFLYLADRYPESQMIPPLNSPARAEFYKYLMLILASLEPALLALETHKDEEVAQNDLKKALMGIEDTLNVPYVLGDQFSAIDILLWSELWWMQAAAKVSLTAYPMLHDYYLAHQDRFEALL